MTDRNSIAFDILERLSRSGKFDSLKGHYARGTGGIDVEAVVLCLDKVAAALDRATDALKPFADAAEGLNDDDPDRAEMWEHPASMSVTVADFRRAAKVLKP